MALFRISKGNEQNLPPIKREGFAYFTLDESDFYIDTKSTDAAIDEPGIRQQLNANRSRYLKSRDKDLYIDEHEISLGRKTGETNFEEPNDPNNPLGVGENSIAVGNQASATGPYSSSFGTNTAASADNAHAEGSGTYAYGQASHAEGTDSQAGGDNSHAEGLNTFASAANAHAEGNNTEASEENAHAEGLDTTASGNSSHAEGNGSIASNDSSHAEGHGTLAEGVWSHSEGYGTEAKSDAAHAEGYETQVTGDYGHAEGYTTKASGKSSHAEGDFSEAKGRGSHAEGTNTESDGNTYLVARVVTVGDQTVQIINPTAEGAGSHAEGIQPYAKGYASHAEGEKTIAWNTAAHSEGSGTVASGIASHSEGTNTVASNLNSHAEGGQSNATGTNAHAEGNKTTASGHTSHAQGVETTASGEGAHAEGYKTTASGQYSHAEGNETTASGNYSHAEGYITQATARKAHAEGEETIASGEASHAEGEKTTSEGQASHAEGGASQALGDYSHAEGYDTLASGDLSHAEGISTQAKAEASHAEGEETIAEGYASHAEGATTHTESAYSHAEGYSTITSGEASHAEGEETVAEGYASHSEGGATYAKKAYSHAEGYATLASGGISHAEGEETVAEGYASHAEGLQSIAIGEQSHAEGNSTKAEGNNSHSEGYGTSALLDSSHAEGYLTTASGFAAHSEGRQNTASGSFSHAEGDGSEAKGESSHAEGIATAAEGIGSHTEGNTSQAIGNYGHAEGTQTKARGENAHAEGQETDAYGKNGHAEGYLTSVVGANGHAEGQETQANGENSHAEGRGSKASTAGHAEGYYTEAGEYAHAEGRSVKATGYNSHAEGESTEATGETAHAEGFNTKAVGFVSHAEGGDLNFEEVLQLTRIVNTESKDIEIKGSQSYGTQSHAQGTNTLAYGHSAHAEGYQTDAIGQASHAEGRQVQAKGKYSHAEGYQTIANGENSHAEGFATIAEGVGAHVEGGNYANDGTSLLTAYIIEKSTHGDLLPNNFVNPSTQAYGIQSHAEGTQTLAHGYSAHAEGIQTIAFKEGSHAEGYKSEAQNNYAHAEGQESIASGQGSHAQNLGTIANGDAQTALGKYNIADTTSAFILGNGTSSSARSNAFTIDWDGNTFIAGKITQGAPGEDDTIVNMNRMQKDLFVSGDGSAPQSPKVAGFYLGKSTTNENRHMDIVSGADYAYIDFNKADVVEDYKVRLIANVATGLTEINWDSSATDKRLNVNGRLFVAGEPVDALEVATKSYVDKQKVYRYDQKITADGTSQVVFGDAALELNAYTGLVYYNGLLLYLGENYSVSNSNTIVLNGWTANNGDIFTITGLQADENAITVAGRLTVGVVGSVNQPVYFSNGIPVPTNPMMQLVSDGSYWGMKDPGGGTAGWIRTTTNGIIPISSGGASNLGTSSWPFLTVYAQNFYGTFNGNATSATTCNYPKGFTGQNAGGWGIQTGTSITDWADGSGGDIDFRKNCPSAGQTSIKVDGRFYQDEGQYMCLDTNNYTSYAPTKTGGGASGTWAISISGKADSVYGRYTGSGGKQGPSYIGANNVRFNMMNGFTGLSLNVGGYLDCMLMNTYSWSDVPYATAFGMLKTTGTPRAFIACGGNSTNWSNAAELLHTSNYTSYTVTKTGSGASGTWGINISGTAQNSKNTGHASYITTGSTSYILVRIKSAQTHWMSAFTLRVYQGYNHYDITFSGYQYGTNYWYSPKATLSSSTITSVSCYFGYVSTNEMWVAIPGGSYTGAKVINVVNGYHPFTDIANAFTIENVSSLPGTHQTTVTASRPWIRGEAVTGAVWNDYAECREADTIEPGYVLVETGDDTLTKSTERLSPFAGVSSDTWGFSQGETDKAKTPIAVAGRVLVYPYQNRDKYKSGDCVCAAPNGTVDIMTREEVIQYPDRIVGTVSSVPTYDKWGGGVDREPVDVNGRIWIKVR